jgi:stearoyl-CoA desaturase (Delta-9 desaturase)
MHHTYSDTKEDPHSPHFFKDIWHMMYHTAKIFRGYVTGKSLPDEQFTKEYIPVWHKLDVLGNSAVSRILFGALYLSVYIVFAPNFWWYLLMPIHLIMGPIQGAVVNWFGHKLGYANYDNGDHSKNTTPFGLIMMGELFQNNHHKDKNDPNFARRWFEFDITYLVMRGLNSVKLIRLKPLVVPVIPVTVK